VILGSPNFVFWVCHSHFVSLFPQVEVQPPGLVSSDLSVAAFVHRSQVEGLNQAVHTRGAKKVEVMTAIKDFKKGIYQLEWEHKR
jgi:hypothetical protein